MNKKARKKAPKKGLNSQGKKRKIALHCISWHISVEILQCLHYSPVKPNPPFTLFTLTSNNHATSSHSLQKDMASKIFLVLALVLTTIFSIHAADPLITSDFVVRNGITPDANFFTFRGLKKSLWGAPKDAVFKATRASQIEMHSGQSISYAALQFAPNESTHPTPTHAQLSSCLWYKVVSWSWFRRPQ